MTTISSLISSDYSKIFISHANPEDNYFATWLATKLTLMGYDVWCDTQALKGGEDFWKDIESAIRNQTIKFLFVVSSASLEKGGTLKELAVADRIRGRGDFILPLRLQAVPHDSFPTEIIRLNAIDFSNNWATGLVQLTEKLESDSTPRKHSFAVDQIREWWRAGIAGTDNLLLHRDEPYWSNWFPCELPKTIYLHQLSHPRMPVSKPPFAVVSSGDWIITFASQECLQDFGSIVHTEKIEVETFLLTKTYLVSSPKFAVKDTNNKIIELINLAFIQFALNKGLRPYELSEGIATYFPAILHDTLSTSRVKLDRYALTYVSLVGESSGSQWHYGIQGRAFLYPKPSLGVSHHIIFTENALPLEATYQHRLRRKVGSGWYNKQWRDRLLAAMLLLAENPDDAAFNIPVSCTQSVKVNIAPLQFVSSIGYSEPR